MPGIDYSIHSLNPIAQGPGAAAQAAQPESFSFKDFLDIINPLQHIPVVSTIYRHLTGDTIGTPEKIAGDGLYGGLTGLVCSLGDTLFQEITGKSVGDTVYAFVTGEHDQNTGVASLPASVKPAASIALPMPEVSLPDFSGLFDSNDDEAEANGPPMPLSPLVAQRATAAYARAGSLQAY